MWGLGLLGAALLLALVEIFVISGGLLSVGAALAALAGLVCLFRYDEVWGLTGSLGTLVLLPVLFWFAVKVWPSTPIGRRVIGAPDEDELARRQEAEASARRALESLVGKQGVVVVELRPLGVVEIDGVRYDASSDTTFVRPGEAVRVVKAEPNQLRVRPAVGTPSGDRPA